MKALFKEMEAVLDAGQALVLVTIIAGHGSTPRGAGARMIVRQDGTTFGTIGGGAIEYQAGKQALDMMKEKRSRSESFILSKNEIAGIGMICGGDVMVYFQYIDNSMTEFRALCTQAVKACDRNEDCWLVTDISDEADWSMGLCGREERFAVSRPSIVEEGPKRYYCEPLVKAGRVYVFGGGHVAQELVPLLTHLNFRCVVYDDRPEFANPQRFPEAVETIVGNFEHIFEAFPVTGGDYIVTMTRGHQYDYLVQRQALQTEAGYIGVMGSRNKIKIINDRLKTEGFTDEDTARFHAPVGTAILAETPAEIAVSIAGELIRTRAEKQGKGK